MSLEHAAGISPAESQCETSKERPVKYELMQGQGFNHSYTTLKPQ